MERAPTIPSESTTLLVTARITSVVISVNATKVTPKLEEYITPEKVFLYTKNINMPKQNASNMAMTIVGIVTFVTLFKKLDLNL
jgi:hypothetical protein